MFTQSQNPSNFYRFRSEVRNILTLKSKEFTDIDFWTFD